MKYRCALLVGRFQPFHNGHLYLIKKTLELAETVVIGIGSTNVSDEKNPWSYDERKAMIDEVIAEEGLKDKVLQIFGIPDFYNDLKWSSHILFGAKRFDVVVGNNEWTNRIMEKIGYPILRLGFYKRYLHEGEKIRELMKKGSKWEDRIPSYLIKFLIPNS